MDFPALKAFVFIVQSGGFTNAAKALKSHKAGLSRTLSLLEKQLGVRLLERTTRRIKLTDIGQAIYDRAVAVLAAMEDIEATAAAQHGEPRGVLRILADPDLGAAGIGRWVNAYVQQHPKVSVEVELSGRAADLLHEGFDLGLRLGVPPSAEDSPHTVAPKLSAVPSKLGAASSKLGAVPSKLGELSYGLYASPAYLERQGTPEDGDDLRQHPLLMFTTAAQRGWRLVTLSRDLRIEGPARLRANNSLLMRDAAVAGLGIALLPNLIGKEEIARGTLRRVLSAWSAPKMPVHAVLPGVGLPTSKVQAFMKVAEALPLA